MTQVERTMGWGWEVEMGVGCYDDDTNRVLLKNNNNNNIIVIIIGFSSPMIRKTSHHNLCACSLSDMWALMKVFFFRYDVTRFMSSIDMLIKIKVFHKYFIGKIFFSVSHISARFFFNVLYFALTYYYCMPIANSREINK